MNQNENIVDSEIRRLLKQFKLPDIHDRFNEEIGRAVEENLGHRAFLQRLLIVEEQGKKERLRRKKIKEAHFEQHKVIEGFDFRFQESVNQSKILDLASLSFLDKKENVILVGPPGVGKSHISTGLGMKACEAGRSVLFANAIELMDYLSECLEKGTLRQRLKKLLKVDLLIIDDLGYLKMDKEKESIFFQLIRQRYEKKSLIVTTNLPFNRWDEIFTNELAAAAVLDRLLHHAHVISISGDSYRVNKKLEEVLDA
ncbi:IS21-like element helper ATPase IstB [Youngiibacter multivorans]|uniref:DNA replication protein DnaC n=1 Tax=Youngiibacter multivorans TaxID=937251 RepID=A0ABS4G6P4_9CLOT|nr:IS21-like element helper ATPase IstB [Youngiibacter multivorans]MBP1920198.1 DNA replication protein DnaC [Youngiibacter multivorans]